MMKQTLLALVHNSNLTFGCLTAVQEYKHVDLENVWLGDNESWLKPERRHNVLQNILLLLVVLIRSRTASAKPMLSRAPS